MDERAEALLREIVANPADNEPRLAFAKHIERHAPAHAALIVAQCTGKATPAQLNAFAAELPALLRDMAIGNLADEADDIVEPRLDRGFFAFPHWHFEHRDFVAIDPDVLFRLAPACTVIHLQDITDFEAVGARLHRFDVLHIDGTYIDSDVVKRLAVTPGYAHLRELRFDDAWCDTASLTALYDSLPALERLHLDVKREVETSLLVTVGRTACARSVRELTVFGHDEPVLDLRGFPALRNLDANSCVVDELFHEAPSRCHALSFGYCDFTSSFRAALNDTRVFARLRELHLHHNPSQREALLGMLASPHFGPLRVLTARDDGAEDQYVVAALGNVAGSLEELRLGFALGDAGLQTLARVPFGRLAWLELASPITPGAARAFAAAPWIRGLRELTFDVSLLDDDGAIALAAALNPECRKTLHGESYAEVFDAFGVTSEDIDSNAADDD